jgi:hypothetical protein
MRNQFACWAAVLDVIFTAQPAKGDEYETQWRLTCRSLDSVAQLHVANAVRSQ